MTYNIFPPRTTGHTVTGQYLARNSLNARDRARLAADIIAGRVQVASGSLTIGQIRTLCRVNQLYLNEARSTDMRRARRSRLAQLTPTDGLSSAAPSVSPRCGTRFLLPSNNRVNIKHLDAIGTGVEAHMRAPKEERRERWT